MMYVRAIPLEREWRMPDLCPICHWSVSQLVRIAGTLAVHLRCAQGVPGAPLRDYCRVFMRATGADDDRPTRKPGRWAIVGTAS
jgi:hypothetical protein